MDRRRAGRGGRRGRSVPRPRGKSAASAHKKSARPKTKHKPAPQEEGLEFSKTSGVSASTKDVLKEGYSSTVHKVPKKLTVTAIKKGGDAARSLLEQLAAPRGDKAKEGVAAKKAPAVGTAKQTTAGEKGVPKKGTAESDKKPKGRSGSVSKAKTAPVDKGDSALSLQQRKVSISVAKKPTDRKVSGQAEPEGGIKQRKTSASSVSSVASKTSFSIDDRDKATRRDSKGRRASSETKQQLQQLSESRPPTAADGKPPLITEPAEGTEVTRTPSVSSISPEDKHGSKKSAEEVAMQKLLKALLKKFSETGFAGAIDKLAEQSETEDESPGGGKSSDEAGKDTNIPDKGSREISDTKGVKPRKTSDFIKELQATVAQRSVKAKQVPSQDAASVLAKLAQHGKAQPGEGDIVAADVRLREPTVQLPEEADQRSTRTISRETELGGSGLSAEEELIEETISEEYLEPSDDPGAYRRPQKITRRQRFIRKRSRSSPFAEGGAVQKLPGHEEEYNVKGRERPRMPREAYEQYPAGSAVLDRTRPLIGQPPDPSTRRWRRKLESSSLQKLPSSEEMHFHPCPHASVPEADWQTQPQVPARSADVWNRGTDSFSFEKPYHMREAREGYVRERPDPGDMGLERGTSLLGAPSSFQQYECPLHIRVCCGTLPPAPEDELRALRTEGDYPDQQEFRRVALDEYFEPDTDSADELSLRSWRKDLKSSRGAPPCPKHISRAEAWANVKTWLDTHTFRTAPQAKVPRKTTRVERRSASDSELVSTATSKRKRPDLTPAKQTSIKPVSSTTKLTDERTRPISPATTSPVRRLITTLRRMRKERYPTPRAPEPYYRESCPHHRRLEPFRSEAKTCCCADFRECPYHGRYDPEKEQLRRTLSQQELLHDLEIDELLREIEREELLCELAKKRLERDTVDAAKKKPDQVASIAAASSRLSKKSSTTKLAVRPSKPLKTSSATAKKPQRCSDAGLEVTGRSLRQSAPKGSPGPSRKWFAWSASAPKRESTSRMPTMAHRGAVVGNTPFVWQVPPPLARLALNVRQPLGKQRSSQVRPPFMNMSAMHRDPTLQPLQTTVGLHALQARNDVNAKQMQNAYHPTNGLLVRPRSELLPSSETRIFTGFVTPKLRYGAGPNDGPFEKLARGPGHVDSFSFSTARLMPVRARSLQQGDNIMSSRQPQISSNAPRRFSDRISRNSGAVSLPSLKGTDFGKGSHDLTVENVGDAVSKLSSKDSAMAAQDDLKSKAQSEDADRSAPTTQSGDAASLPTAVGATAIPVALLAPPHSDGEKKQDVNEGSDEHVETKSGSKAEQSGESASSLAPPLKEGEGQQKPMKLSQASDEHSQVKSASEAEPPLGLAIPLARPQSVDDTQQRPKTPSEVSDKHVETKSGSKEEPSGGSATLAAPPLSDGEKKQKRATPSEESDKHAETKTESEAEKPPGDSPMPADPTKPPLSDEDEQNEAKAASDISAASPAKSKDHDSSAASEKVTEKSKSEENVPAEADAETGIPKVEAEIPVVIEEREDDFPPVLSLVPQPMQDEQQGWSLAGASTKLFPETELLVFVSLLCIVWIVILGFLTSGNVRNVEVITRSWPPFLTQRSCQTTHTHVTSSSTVKPAVLHLCDSDYCRKEGAYLGSLLRDKEPCDNFYEYVCDAWIQNVVPPAVDILWEVSTDTAIEYDIENHAMRYIRDPLNSRNVKPAGGLYRACMNRVKVENSGIHYAREMFSTWRIKRWPLVKAWTGDEDDVWAFAGELVRDLGLDVLLTLTVATHPLDRRRRIAALDKPKMLLVDKDMPVPEVLELLRAAIEETASQFGVHDAFALYSDIISVFSNFTTAVALTGIYKQIYKLVTVVDVNDGIRILLEEAFRNVTTVHRDTQLLLVSPDFIENRLGYILRVETPQALLNYLGFRALVFMAPFFHQSLGNFGRLFSLQVFGRVVPAKRALFCLRAIEQVLPRCVLRAYAQSHMRHATHYRVWLSQLEDIFLKNVGDIAWFDDITGLLLRYKLRHTYVEAFFPDEVLDVKLPCGPKYRVDPWDSPLKAYHDLSQRRQKTVLEEVSGAGVLKPRLSGLFQTAATYDVPLQMVRIPVGVVNISVPNNRTVFDFHNSRLAVRVYSALVSILFEGTTYEMETPLEFTDEAEKILKGLLNCFAIEFATLPPSLRDSSHTVVENVNWILRALVAHTQALQMAFRAFRELLHIRRVWNVDFRLSTLSNVSADQLFFLYYALDNCEYSDTNLKRHAYRKLRKIPPADRVNIALRHTAAFHTAFRCEQGAPMNAPTMCLVLKQQKQRRRA